MYAIAYVIEPDEASSTTLCLTYRLKVPVNAVLAAPMPSEAVTVADDASVHAELSVEC